MQRLLQGGRHVQVAVLRDGTEPLVAPWRKALPVCISTCTHCICRAVRVPEPTNPEHPEQQKEATQLQHLLVEGTVSPDNGRCTPSQHGLYRQPGSAVAVSVYILLYSSVWTDSCFKYV